MVPRWPPRPSQEGSWGGLGPLLGALGLFLEALRRLLGRLEGVLGCFWELLGPRCNGLGGPLMFVVCVDLFCFAWNFVVDVW